MAANNNTERGPREEYRAPNTEPTTSINRSSQRNFRNAGPSSRAIRDFVLEKGRTLK